MTTELEWRALAILRASLETDPGEREEFIERSCGDDGELQQRVLALIRAVSKVDPGDRGLRAAGGSSGVAGQILSHRYRLLRRLGSGGMGEVWLAERVDGDFEQKVAVKLVHSGLATLVERFRREKQILARLQHPNIAHLMDGGTSDDGRPWLALEYVGGRQLLEWCADHRLTVEQRLQLLLPVCEAVQFAHRNLVVHRDIKPANLLVTDGGVPKLLDFGIAKLVDDEADPAATGTLLMTPAYAAPEQLRGEPVSTATDVYQLGLLIYELLAGVPAHRARQRRGAALGAALPSMEQALIELQREAPGQAAAAAAERRISPDRLRTLLRGDLGRIVALATTDDPAQRYGSAQQLADDLGRWLQRLPVQARRGNWRYRLRKFASRNRALVALSAGVLLLLVGGVAAVLWQADAALREARRANAVQDYLFDVFEASVPGAPTDRLPDTRELLDRGRELAMAERDDDDDTQAAMLTAMARIHRQLGLYDESRAMIERALELRLQRHGEAHPLYRHSLFELGESLRLEAALEDALPVLRQVLKLILEYGGGATEEAAVRQSLGTVLSLQFQHEQAIAELQRALDLRVDDGAHSGWVDNMQALALALDRADRHSEAIEHYQQALEMAVEVYGPVHAELAGLLANYGALLRPLGRYDEAAQVLGEAVAINEAVYDRPHPRAATHLRNLGAALSYLGRNDEAETALQRAQQQSVALYGEDSLDVARTAINLAGVQIERRRFQAAVATLRNALRIFAANEAVESRREIGFASLNLGRALRGLGEHEAAEAAIRRAIEVRGEIHGGEHPDTAHAIAALGVLQRERGRLDESEELLRRSLRFTAAALPASNPRVAQRHADLAETLLRRQACPEAQQLFAEALRLALAAGLEPAHVQVVEARLGIARCALQLGERAEALAQADVIAELVDRVFAEGDPQREAWAELQLALGR